MTRILHEHLREDLLGSAHVVQLLLVQLRGLDPHVRHDAVEQPRALLLDAAQAIVVAPFWIGPSNLANLEDLLPFAGRVPIFLMGGSNWTTRDFTGGAAAKLRDQLLAAGARPIDGPAELVRALEAADARPADESVGPALPS